jgi:hypothetical protein
MRTSPNLPRVSCPLSLTDGVADIEASQSAARAADWTRNEINVAVLRAAYEGTYFEDVGQLLHHYCRGEPITAGVLNGALILA